MEALKVLILVLLMQSARICDAQYSKPFVHRGMMSISTGLTGGVMAFNPIQNVYVNGNFFYCVEQQIAVRADFNIFLPDYNFKGQLQKNSSIFLGPEFHFPFGRFDLSLLFEPGLAFPYLETGVHNGKSQAEPVFLLALGTSYYFFQNFHFSIHGGYLHGNYYLESTKPFSLDELRITATLGINIFVNHQAAFERKGVKF